MLSDFLPRGRPVMLGEPAREYYALCLRACDLADLEQIGRAMMTSVFDTVPESAEDTPEYRKALNDALDVAERGEPGWGDPELRKAVLATDAGLLTILRAALRSHDMTHAAVEKLASELSPRQWNDVLHIAFGGDVAHEILRRIDALINAPAITGTGRPWVEALCEVCREFGYTPHQAGELTLTQVSLLLSGGKRQDVWYFDAEGATPEEYDLYANELQPKREAFFKAFKSADGDEELAGDAADEVAAAPTQDADLDSPIAVSPLARRGGVRKDQ